VSSPSEVGAEEGEGREQARPTQLGLWPVLGRLRPSERREREKESSWAEAAAGPPVSVDRAEREKVKEVFLLFYFLKIN
jgi:hypothetical protein